jgi:4-hydroxy-tetrahydrodipicolinate synthase
VLGTEFSKYNLYFVGNSKSDISIMNSQFTGSIPALITPMKMDGAIDYASLENLINWHIEQQTDALVIAGTSGESATLSMAEHSELIAKAVEITDKRIPIIAGTGANSTTEAIELTQHAKASGADACLLVTPYYNKPVQQGLIEHFSLIAKTVDIPQILYNVPGRTCCDILPETVAELAKIDNIIGIKDATGDVQRLREMQPLIKDIDSNFIFLSGEDGTTCEFILNGGHGGITVTGNAAPKLNRQMYAYARQGEAAKAQEIDQKLQGLHCELFCQSNPIPVKWALSQMGFCENSYRLPLTPLQAEFHSQVKKAMQQAEINI